jgi:hypothetical protein
LHSSGTAIHQNKLFNMLKILTFRS